jgi:sugar lactone lactonase YvrE
LPKGTRTVARISSGWLVGFDAGEFGSSLWWFDTAGRRKALLDRIHVMRFLPHDVESDAVDLHGKPRAITKARDGSLIIVTKDGVLRYEPRGRRLIVLSRADLGAHDPSSVATSLDGRVYVGMRHYIFRLRATSEGYDSSWLVHTACTGRSLDRTKARRADVDCLCRQGNLPNVTSMDNNLVARLR